MSEKNTVSFLRWLASWTSCAPRKDRIVNLRRKILGELARQDFQFHVLLGDLLDRELLFLGHGVQLGLVPVGDAYEAAESS